MRYNKDCVGLWGSLFKKEGMRPFSVSFHPAAWNVDVIAGAPVAMLHYEAEACVEVVEQERGNPDSR